MPIYSYMIITIRNAAISALLYYLFGRLGLLLAIPPGFASTVWPAAGIALGLGLTLGRGVFLGTIIGSTLNNLIPFLEAGQDFSNLTPIYLGFFIGIGAAVQMHLGRVLIQKITLKNNDEELSKSDNILKVLFIAIPTSCLVNGLWGSFILYFFNIIPINSYFSSAATWYLGDTLGACVFTPLWLSIFKKSKLWQSRRVVYTIPMFLLISLVFMVFILERDNEQLARVKDFEEKASDIQLKIERTINSNSETLEYLKDLYLIDGNISAKKFHYLTGSMVQRHKEINALSWNPIISDKERSRFEESIKIQGFKNFEIKERIDSNIVTSKREEYYVVVGFIEPYEANKLAHGFNINSNLERKKAIDLSISTKQKVATAPINLVQSNNNLGQLILSPIIKNDKVEAFVVSIINLDQIFIEILRNLNVKGIEFSIFDITKESSDKAPSLIFATDKEFSPDKVSFDINIKKPGTLTKTAFFQNYNRKWEIIFYQTPNYFINNQSILTWIIICAGLFICLITGTFILIISGREYHLKQLSKKLQESQENLTYFNENLENKIAQRTNELEKASKVKSIFLANMSHEIRTPLNGIIGSAQLLENCKDEEEFKSYTDTIKSSGKLLLSIINDILDLSKLESDKLTLEELEVNLIEVANQSLDMVRTSLNNNNIFNLYFDASFNYDIYGDPVRIPQILTNLLSNANKFTLNGNIDLHITILEETPDNKKIEFKIIDNGRGIDNENLKNIFKPFSQEDETTTRKFGGTGLGLSICKQLVKLMGGEISVTSQLNKGSCFSFYINVRSWKGKKLSSQIDYGDLHFLDSSFLALIAEDNLVNQKILKAFLDKFKIKSSIANNGQEAIDFLKDNKPNIIFMDYNMPVMDGIEATKFIRKNIDPDHKIKIVAVSASVTKEIREEYLRAGMDEVLSKPINKTTLELILKKFFK